MWDVFDKLLSIIFENAFSVLPSIKLIYNKLEIIYCTKKKQFETIIANQLFNTVVNLVFYDY